MATSARDVMTADAKCVQEDDTIRTAAEALAENGVGAMPICGNDNRLKGMLTDRDITDRGRRQGQGPRQHEGQRARRTASR